MEEALALPFEAPQVSSSCSSRPHGPSGQRHRLGNFQEQQRRPHVPSQVLSPFVLCNQSEPEAKHVLEKNTAPFCPLPAPPHPSLSVNPNASDLRLLSAVPPRLAFWWQSHQASVSRSADVLTA